MVVSDKEIAVGEDYRWRVYAQGDFGFADVDNVAGVTGYNADTYVATAGAEYWWTDWLRSGLAASYVTNETDFNSSLADIDLNGYQVTAYTTAFFGGFYADLLYSYGAQSQDITRNTPFGSTANGNNVGSHTHTGILNLGYNFYLPCGKPGEEIVTGPIGRLKYVNGTIDAYSETGSTPISLLAFPEQNVESLQSELGWQASKSFIVSPSLVITPQVRAAWGHEAMDDPRNVTVAVVGAPLLNASGSTLSPGRDWLHTGGGINFRVAYQWDILADYTAEAFRTDTFIQYVTVQASFSF